jgi:catechol 2,3-dioxygenase-like lactoylglutathione lyase family enzyme
MPLSHIEHFLLQTDDMEATRDWYVRVLGMRVGPSPDFKFPVVWLYLGDKDVVHVTQGGEGVSENRKRYVGQQSTEVRGTGVVDHIAFRASGLKQTVEHLKSLGIAFRSRRVSDQGLYQLFLIDPNDVKIELNFDQAEADAAGIAPDLVASALHR